MKHSLILALTAALTLVAADDPWQKVQELKSGTELRIQKKGAAQPVLAQMDEANEERIVVVVKNEQVAIAKDQIDRIDFRPKAGSRIVKETKTTTSAPGNPSPAEQRIGGGPPGPSGSSSSSLTFGSKPDFETIYRRAPMPLPKKPQP
jgi:hypothetical protein